MLTTVEVTERLHAGTLQPQHQGCSPVEPPVIERTRIAGSNTLTTSTKGCLDDGVEPLLHIRRVELVLGKKEPRRSLFECTCIKIKIAEVSLVGRSATRRCLPRFGQEPRNVVAVLSHVVRVRHNPG